MDRPVDMGLEDEVLLLTVIAHQILDTLPSLITVDSFNKLKQTLFVLLDILDAETSKESKLIRHLRFQHINEVFKEKYDDGETSTAAVRTWMETMRMLLVELSDALDDIKSSTDLQTEGSQTLGQFSITVDKLGAAISDRPVDPHRDIRKLLRFNHSCIIDRPDDVNAITRLLLEPLSESSSWRKGDIGVIPIVGDAGCGKSVLAKLVYDDQRVKDHFDLKMWVSLHNCYPDELRFTQSLINSASGSSMENNLDISPDLNYLQKKLRDLLFRRKFLLVLDSVSIETCCHWNVLRTPLVAGANSSIILLTTRSSMVSSQLGTVQPYFLKPLSNEDCCSLFRYFACGYSKVDNNTNGTAHLSPPVKQSNCFREIVRLFKGFPSPSIVAEVAEAGPSIVAEAGILIQYFGEMVSLFKGFPSIVAGAGILVAACIEDKRKLRILKAMRSDCLHARLTNRFTSDHLWTYHGLSSTHLKQCFVYCALFPKRYLFKKRKLILLWMAEGFLRPEDGMRIEDVGVVYFAELLEKSFLQSEVVDNFDESFYCMPEHIYNLADYISSCGDGYLKLHEKNQSCVSSPSNISEYTRYYSSFCRETVNQQTTEALYKSMGLNTLLLCNTRIWEVSRNLFPNLTRVRVLDLRNASLSDLPDSICELRHLRFLDLSKNNISHLPKKLSMLHNLQTLIINSNVGVFQFPAGMEKLLNLRHLDLGSYKPFVRPPRIEQLTNLHTLRTITVVGYHHAVWRTGVLRELVNLRELRVTFKFGFLFDQEKETDYRDILVNMKYLQRLELFWSCLEIEHAENLLAGFQPHTNVKHLVLRSYPGIKFPDWVGNPSFSNLEIVRFCGCCYCEFLPPLGQLPLLKYLRVEGPMDAFNYIDGGFCGNKMANDKRFPSLKTLELVTLPRLERWTDLLDGDMPLLQELNIVDCKRLISLPTLKYLRSLQKLHIEFCEKLQDFPDKKPPRGLNFLAILYCPLLLEACEKHKDWRKMLKTAEEVEPLQWYVIAGFIYHL